MRNVNPIELASRFVFSALPIMFNGRLQAPFVSEHRHEFDEIVLVTVGSGIHHTRFGSQRIAAGEVLIIPEGESHAYSECGDMVIYNCMIRIRQIPLPLGELYHHPSFVALFLGTKEQYERDGGFPHIRLNTKNALRAEAIMQRCNLEAETRKLGWSLSCFGGFLEYLTILLRHYHTAENDAGYCSQKVRECLHLINAYPEQQHSVAWFCRKVGLSKSTLYRYFKRATGMSILDYQLTIRLSQAAYQLLNDRERSICEIAQQAGFKDSNYFSRLFRNRFQMSPREYRQRGDMATDVCDHQNIT